MRQPGRVEPPQLLASEASARAGVRDYLVDEGQMPLDSCLILFPLQRELVAKLLLGLFNVPDGQFPLLSLLDAGEK